MYNSFCTARDTGVHLSKARISFLGEKCFRLVCVLYCFMDPTAYARHRHLNLNVVILMKNLELRASYKM